jgi:hypothetical protein
MIIMTEADLSTTRHPKICAGLSSEKMRLQLLEDFLSLKTHEQMNQIYFSNLKNEITYIIHNTRCSRLPFYNV